MKKYLGGYCILTTIAALDRYGPNAQNFRRSHISKDYQYAAHR